MRYFLFTLVILFTINCKSQKSTSSNKELTKEEVKVFDGEYQCFTCNCLLIINTSDLVYEFENQNFKKKGSLSVKYIDKSIFFQFENLYGEYTQKPITAEFIDRTIVIQNYGNAMNEFIRFSECDSKYIELHKVE